MSELVACGAGVSDASTSPERLWKPARPSPAATSTVASRHVRAVGSTMLPELEWLATSQDGLLTRADALAAGVPPDTLAGWVRSGRLRVVHRGVYALTGTPASVRQQARAAVLATRHPAAAASFETAALVHRVGVLATAGTPHVTLPTAVHRPSRTTLQVHRCDLVPADIIDLDGLRATALPRTP